MCKQDICTRHCASVNVFGQYITAFAAFSVCTANLAIIERKRGEKEHLLSLFIFAFYLFISLCHSIVSAFPCQFLCFNEGVCAVSLLT